MTRSVAHARQALVLAGNLRCTCHVDQAFSHVVDAFGLHKKIEKGRCKSVRKTIEKIFLN
jgi:hypothetical protein